MSEQNTVSINTGDEGAKGPSLQEQYDALVKEGVIAPDGDTPQDESTKVAQGGADGTSEGSNDERPSWLPEKFKSPEDLAKAYDELQKKLGCIIPEKVNPFVDDSGHVERTVQQIVDVVFGFARAKEAATR